MSYNDSLAASNPNSTKRKEIAIFPNISSSRNPKHFKELPFFWKNENDQQYFVYVEQERERKKEKKVAT